ncbi:hypothetical protein [Glutamicibacter creatinolyticus]|uniref:hypothetical protein n=1 Tax=Glutamicibacter creatinolyticus TaxID=162496 RepID=UPI0031E24988
MTDSNEVAMPTEQQSQSTNFPNGQMSLVIQSGPAVGGTNFHDSQAPNGCQAPSAAVDQTSRNSIDVASTQRGDESRDHHPEGDAIPSPNPIDHVRSLLDPLLTLASITLDDLETLRVAQENRYRSLTTAGTSDNGLEWGYGLDDRDPSVAAAGAMVDQIKALEHQSVLQLQRLMRKHPLGPWVKAQKGIGEKLCARLLGVIGDPYWHTAENRPRTVSELWAYCGLKPGQRRRKGERANWSTEAKTYAYLLAESTMKQLDRNCKTDTGIADHVDGCKCSPYRIVFDTRKALTVGREHATECVRCGPSGKPAHPGSEWSKAHQQADALRYVSKMILRDLWRESKRIHKEQ